MGEQVEGAILAVPGEKPARAQGQRPLGHVEHVLADDARDGRCQPHRIAKSRERSRDELRPDLLVRALAELGVRVEVEPAVRAAPGRRGLARIVEERREADAEPRAGVGGRLDDAEEVLVERQLVVAALLVEADRRFELGQDLDERAGVAREPERLRRRGAEEELRELAQAVAREPASDPLAGDVDESRRPFPHLPLRLGIEVEAELRDEAETAHDSQRIVLEAHARSSSAGSGARGRQPAERIDQLARRQPARDRVDREVAPGHVLAQRDRGVGGDLEVVAARPRRALDARRRELDPGRLKGARLPVSREEAHADPLLRDDQILDLPVRLERRAQLGVADPGHDEVALLDGQARAARCGPRPPTT